MLILYGLMDRDRHVKGGSFACPQCGKQTYCTRRKIEAWYTLFFLPIFPAEVRNEYLKCNDCRHSFLLPALEPYLPAGGYLPSDLKAELYAGAPFEDVEARLVDSGVDRDSASRVIFEIVGDVRKRCPTCGLTYQEHLSHCKKCDQPLVKIAPRKIGFDLVDGF